MVFNKEVPVKPKDKKDKKKEDLKKKKKPSQYEVQDELDLYHRPMQKVLCIYWDIFVIYLKGF